MTYEVQQTRWDRIVRRVTGSVGPGSRVSETISELMPVLDIERVPGELLLLGGTRIAWGGANLTGVAGNTGKIQLFNPVDSGSIITVTKVYVRLPSAGILRMVIEPVARLTDGASARYRDGRMGVAEIPVGQIRTETTATIISLINQIFLDSNDTVQLRDENSLAVLGPGTGLTFGPSTTNVTVTGGFFWRERPAEEAELQF